MSFLASPAPPSASAGGPPSAPRSHAGGAAGGYEPPAPYVISSPAGRLLCVADVRGNLAHLNDLAARHNAHAIVHTGDFGFYEAESIARVADRTLRHLVQYSTLLSPAQRNSLLSDGARPGGAPGAPSASLRSGVSISMLSSLPQLLSGALTLAVPVYAVWGACEDVCVLERFRTGEYAVPNLHILDEATSHAIDVGGVRLRLFGLGGAVVLHKLFDNGEGNATIAGAGGTMWTTMLQIGELIDTAQKCWDPSEVRMLITHASPGREGLLSQLALQLKADLTLSAGLHFRYGVSYNEFSVQSSASQLRTKLTEARAAFTEVWEAVSTQVEAVIDERQRVLLNHALAVTRRIPPAATPNGAVAEEPAAKTMWNWNLPDAAYGALVLEVEGGRVGATMHSQGFTFAHRREAAAAAAQKQGISPSNSASLKPASQPHTPAGPKATQQQQQQPAQQQAPPRSAGGASNKSFNGEQQARRGGVNGSTAHSNASVPASPAKSRRTKSTASTASALSSAPSGAPSAASRVAEEKSGDDEAAAAPGTGATPEGVKRKTTRGGKKNRSKKEGGAAAAAAAAGGNEAASGQSQEKSAPAASAPAAPSAPAAAQGGAESK